MPAVFRCEECEEYYDESELALDTDEWICETCATCDCGERKCDECLERTQGEPGYLDAATEANQ